MDITDILKDFYTLEENDSAEYLDGNIIKVIRKGKTLLYAVNNNKLYRLEKVSGEEHLIKFKTILRDVKINLLQNETN